MVSTKFLALTQVVKKARRFFGAGSFTSLYLLGSDYSLPPKRRTNHDRKLRVYAVANDHGWHFIIREGYTPIASDFGLLPTGFRFNQETATLYALAQAARFIERSLPNSRVIMVCTDNHLLPHFGGRQLK